MAFLWSSAWWACAEGVPHDLYDGERLCSVQLGQGPTVHRHLGSFFASFTTVCLLRVRRVGDKRDVVSDHTDVQMIPFGSRDFSQMALPLPVSPCRIFPPYHFSTVQQLVAWFSWHRARRKYSRTRMAPWHLFPTTISIQASEMKIVCSRITTVSEHRCWSQKGRAGSVQKRPRRIEITLRHGSSVCPFTDISHCILDTHLPAQEGWPEAWSVRGVSSDPTVSDGGYRYTQSVSQ